MLIAIDYGDGDVEEFDSASRQFDHMMPAGHVQRVAKVSSIIGAALKRRAFFKGLADLGSQELLDSEHSYHEEYKRHLRELADIPYDGYHTDYSLWALEYANQQQDKELVSPESAAVESLRSLGSLGFPSSPSSPSSPSAPGSIASLSDRKVSTYVYEPAFRSAPNAKEAQSGSNELLGLPFIKQLGTDEVIDEAKGVDRADDAGEFDDTDEVNQAAGANETSEVDQAVRSDQPGRWDQVNEASETDPKTSPKTESQNNDPHPDGKSYDR